MSLKRLFSVGALAAAALLLETTLTRLLAVAQYYHFAFLVISLALLGFGASGSILMLWPGLVGDQASGEKRTDRIDYLLGWCGIAFALSVGVAYIVVNLLPFDSYSIAWDRRQILYFVVYYLVLALPFVCAGLGIGGALAASQGYSHLIYASNLLGSAMGVLLAPGILWLAGVPGGIALSGLVGLLAAWANKSRKGLVISGGLVIATLCLLVALFWLSSTNLVGKSPLGLTVSPYKGLAYARRVPGSESLFGRWNAISRVDVIAGSSSRQLPGLSYMYADIPPEQFGLSLDAEALQPITLVKPEDFTAAAYLPEALAFELLPQALVLVVEPAGGLGVLQALAGGANQVTAVFSDPLVARAVSVTAGELDPYIKPAVQVRFQNPRAFFRQDRQAYDLVFLPLTDAYRPVTSGAYSLSEAYLFTVQSMADILKRLTPSGMLVVSRWLQTPPSEETRLFTTLVEALEANGVSDPRQALVAYRGVQTLTSLVQPHGWSKVELDKVKTFTESRRFDLVWMPGITPEETNRFNRLPESSYFTLLKDFFLATDRKAFYKAYPYAITPQTDNQPFFFHFFTWKQTPELIAAFGHTWQPFGGSGYFVLLAMLGLVVLLSSVLILVPLNIDFWRKNTPHDHHLARESNETNRVGVLVYFGSIGLGYLFVEIPLIQRWILIFGNPTYAFTVVVLVLLAFSSLGSLLSKYVWRQRRWLLGGLILIALATAWVVARYSGYMLALPEGLRAVLAALSLAPLAILMGMPYPFGMAWIERKAGRLIPWAWAVNGCASVVASILAALFALSYGFTLVLLMGAGAYALALIVLPGERHEPYSSQVRSL